jgi:hypothetical protein
MVGPADQHPREQQAQPKFSPKTLSGQPLEMDSSRRRNNEWTIRKERPHAVRFAQPDGSIAVMRIRANPIAIDDVIETTPPV